MANNKPDEGSLKLTRQNKDSDATSVNHTARYIKLTNNLEEHRLLFMIKISMLKNLKGFSTRNSTRTYHY